MPNLGRTLVRNTLSGAAAYVVNLVVSLLLAPYLLAKLGPELFGVWIILVVITNYFSLLDLGVSLSFVKHLAEAETLGRHASRNTIVATGWVFYAAFSLVTVAGGLALQPLVFGFLHLSADVTLIYWGVLAIFAIRNSCVVYRSLLFALQRIDVLNAISMAAAVINAVAVVTVLALGYGLAGLVAVSLVLAVFHVTAEVISAYRCCHGLRLNPFAASRRMFRTLFHYGINLQASRLADLVYLHIDKLLLGHFVGFGPVTFYELGGKVAGLTRSFPTVLLQGLLPAASELEAQRNRERLLRLYLKSSKYLAALAFPLATFSILEAKRVMSVWLGAGAHDGAVLAMQVLTVAYLLHLLMEAAMAVARGIGVVQFEMRALIVTAGLNVGLSALLIMAYGLAGALIGTAVSMAIGYGLFMRSFHRYVAMPFAVLVKDVYLVPLIGAAAAAAVVLAAGYSLEMAAPMADTSRLTGLLVLSVKSLLFVGVYAGVMWKRGYIAVSDVHLFRQAVWTSS
jgi:O-antigen/teichoic acid export membrane protein